MIIFTTNQIYIVFVNRKSRLFTEKTVEKCCGLWNQIERLKMIKTDFNGVNSPTDRI